MNYSRPIHLSTVSVASDREAPREPFQDIARKRKKTYCSRMRSHISQKMPIKIIRVVIVAFCGCVLLFSDTGCQVKTSGQVQTDVGVYH